VEHNILVRTYQGTEYKALTSFEIDAKRLKIKGYSAISQNYQQGQWGAGAFIIALLLCFIIIGIVALIYMIIVKPAGTLTVRYKMINTEDLNEFVSLYIDNIKIARNERSLRMIYEKIENNNLDISDENISRGISKIEQLRNGFSTEKSKNIKLKQSPENTLTNNISERIRQLNILKNEELISDEEFNLKKNEILELL